MDFIIVQKLNCFDLRFKQGLDNQEEFKSKESESWKWEVGRFTQIKRRLNYIK